MYYLMAVKDCFAKRKISYNFSRTCTDKDYIKPIRDAYIIGYKKPKLNNLVLRTGNGPRYIVRELKSTTRLLNSHHVYMGKQTPEDTIDIESFHNSTKSRYIWQNHTENDKDSKELIEYTFNYYRAHSSIDYFTPVEYKKAMKQL